MEQMSQSCQALQALISPAAQHFPGSLIVTSQLPTQGHSNAESALEASTINQPGAWDQAHSQPPLVRSSTPTKQAARIELSEARRWKRRVERAPQPTHASQLMRPSPTDEASDSALSVLRRKAGSVERAPQPTYASPSVRPSPQRNGSY
jgi:hypothetical protein